MKSALNSEGCTVFIPYYIFSTTKQLDVPVYFLMILMIFILENCKLKALTLAPSLRYLSGVFDVGPQNTTPDRRNLKTQLTITGIWI